MSRPTRDGCPRHRVAHTPSALGLAAEHRFNLVELEFLHAQTINDIASEFSEENKKCAESITLAQHMSIVATVPQVISNRWS